MTLQTRINLEKRIVRKVVRALLAAGYTLTVDNGGDGHEIPWSRDFHTVVGAMFATDEERLLVRAPEGRNPAYSFVFFVYGNDGWDVINDYGLSLEPVLGPINEYCNKLELIHS